MRPLLHRSEPRSGTHVKHSPPKASSTSEGMVETEQQSSESSHAAIRTVALLLMRHEIRNLRRWFEEFDRDILLPILLGEIAMHNTGAFEHASANGNGGRNGRADEGLPSSPDAWRTCTLRHCNAYSIAAATGLPRETVRRKIVRLVELGWVERRGNGHLFVTEVAFDHFGKVLTSRELSEVIETADRARKLLQE